MHTYVITSIVTYEIEVEASTLQGALAQAIKTNKQERWEVTGEEYMVQTIDQWTRAHDEITDHHL